jgi:hypothetical protein
MGNLPSKEIPAVCSTTAVVSSAFGWLTIEPIVKSLGGISGETAGKVVWYARAETQVSLDKFTARGDGNRAARQVFPLSPEKVF